MKKTLAGYLVSLCLVIVLMTGMVSSVFAAESGPDGMKLKDPDTSGNTAFLVENMFPGDAETKEFTVTVSHKEPISVYYHADIRPGSEKLAEVMKVKIELLEKGETLYDGLMREMPSALEHRLAASEQELVYRITVYLDTRVGNEYQRKELIADFRWWYMEETDDGDGSGDGGDSGDSGDSEDSGSSGGGSSSGSGTGSGSGGSTGSGGSIGPGGQVLASVKLAAEKVLDGEYPRGNDFTFVLADEAGNVIQTVKNRDGLIEFDMIRLSAPGVFTYYITEQPGTDERMFYDSSVYKAVVTVAEEQGVWVARVVYEKDGEAYPVLPRFVNETEEGRLAGVWDHNPTIPKTGDDSPIARYLVLCISSLTACLFLLVMLMKKGRRRNEG